MSLISPRKHAVGGYSLEVPHSVMSSITCFHGEVRKKINPDNPLVWWSFVEILIKEVQKAKIITLPGKYLLWVLIINTYMRHL